jgi:hypothetical protein
MSRIGQQTFRESISIGEYQRYCVIGELLGSRSTVDKNRLVNTVGYTNAPASDSRNHPG